MALAMSTTLTSTTVVTRTFIFLISCLSTNSACRKVDYNLIDTFIYLSTWDMEKSSCLLAATRTLSLAPSWSVAAGGMTLLTGSVR